MSVQDHIDAIADHIRQNQPWDRLPPTLYLDAQAVVQWGRIGVLGKVLTAVPPASGDQARFQLEDTVLNEAAFALAERIGDRTKEEWLSELRQLPNLFVADPLLEDGDTKMRALELRLQLAITEAQRTGVSRQAIGEKRHLGEAEVLAQIERFESDAAFVTADIDATEVAGDLGILTVHPFAVLAAAFPSIDDVVDMWMYTCEDRACATDDETRRACRSALVCQDPASASSDAELPLRYSSAELVVSQALRQLQTVSRRLSR